MTKSDLINKWQKEADQWKIAADDTKLKDKTRTMAYNRHKQLLLCIGDIKILNGNTVKLREVCSKKTQHRNMKSAKWKYCCECGLKL